MLRLNSCNPIRTQLDNKKVKLVLPLDKQKNQSVNNMARLEAKLAVLEEFKVKPVSNTELLVKLKVKQLLKAKLESLLAQLEKSTMVPKEAILEKPPVKLV